MINNDQKFDEENFVIEPIYNENRQKIIQIIRMVNIALNNSSQTFFMCLYYMDLIFTNKNFEDILKLFYEYKESDLKREVKNDNLVKISLACLIIATKYIENDPHVPNIISFINLCSHYSNNKYNFQVDELFKAEVIVLKFLEYKLNFYTIYHYFTFFFTHGFFYENIFENEKLKINKSNKNDLLEKIYIISREIMDKFIEENENLIYILGKNNYFTSIQILIWSTEHILNIPFLNLFNEKKNIFELIYNINYDENKEKNEIIKNKIQNIYNNNIQKKELEKKNHINKDLSQINPINKEKNLPNNNMCISSDNFYKYFKLPKNNLNSNENYKISKYIPKYIYDSKNNKTISKSTDNNRYNQLFQFGNKINKENIFKAIFSSDKKKIENKKEEEQNVQRKENELKNLGDDKTKKFIKNNTINSLCISNNSRKNNINNNIKDSINKSKNSSIDLNQRYNNHNNLLNSFSNNNYKNIRVDIQNYNNYLNKKNIKNNEKIIYDNNLNEKNKEIIFRTKNILEFNFPFPGQAKTNDFNDFNYQNFRNNNPTNLYPHKPYKTNLTLKNKKYYINDRYNMKENIQDNNNINIFNSGNIINKNNEFFNVKKYEEENLNSYNKNKNDIIYKKEENKLNNNFSSYKTYYQYNKLNKYENIDKFYNLNQNQNKDYLQFNFKSWNKYY